MIGQIEAERISTTMRLAEVEVLLNCDKTFRKFYMEEIHVIAPVGATRVGSTNKTHDKKGCTGIMTIEFYTSEVLPPFMILNGTYKGL